MSDLQNLINKLKVSNAIPQSYIYYKKDTGKIDKISSKNIAEDGYEIFEISSKEVTTILTGEKRLDEFVIFYDVSAKEVRLKEIAYDDNHKTASTMCYQLPVVKRDIRELYIENFTKIISMTPQYTGIYVDVWYDELSHLAGQHVWINDIVYKVLTDQSANTKFTTDNAEVIVENVKLYSDINKSLVVDDTIDVGDLILKNNSIFLFDYTDTNLESDIIIRQDIVNSEWNIRINSHTSKFLRMSGYNPNETLYFSITSKYDPNILYRSLEFTVGNLLSDKTFIIPFKYDSESNADDVSIYTAKYFESYAHEII